MALTQEERDLAEKYAYGALLVYDQGMASLKATEEDILQKVNAWKIEIAKAVKEHEDNKIALETAKDKDSAHMPETSPSPSDQFNEEKGELLQSGDAVVDNSGSSEAGAEALRDADEKAHEEGEKIADHDAELEKKQADKDAEKAETPS